MCVEREKQKTKLLTTQKPEDLCFHDVYEKLDHYSPILPPVSYRKCVLVAMSGSAVVNKHDKFPLGASSVSALDLRSLRPGFTWVCLLAVAVCLAASSTIL